MSQRRYTEEEVSRIFERAARAQQKDPRSPTAADGATLADLQEIGREVGIPAALVARAARDLDRPQQPATRRFLGLPVGVGRTLELPRRLTEREWEQLVVDLRETFDAKGRVRVEGGFRQWTNGNLQVLVEPSGDGQRVRMRTLHGSARGMLMGGVTMASLAAVLYGATIVTGSPATDPSSLTTILAFAAVLLGGGAIRLPGWARRRQQQMDAIAARVEQLALTTAATHDADRDPGSSGPE